MKQVYVKPDSSGWTYYIDTGFAWFPMYCQGTLVWLRRYWVTWPEDKDGKLILAEDVLPEEKGKPLGKEEMYRVYFPYDPRKS